MSLPIVHTSGVLTELPIGKGVAPAPRVLSNPGVNDVGDGEMIFDTANGVLILRQGSLLLTFAQTGSPRSYPSALDFSKSSNSIWIGSNII